MIIITGGSRGIGEFLVNRFESDFLMQDVRSCYHHTAPTRHNDLYSYVDIKRPRDVKDWIDYIVQGQERIVLVNCAGSNYNAFAHKADLIEWNKVIYVNLCGTFNVIQAVLPHMRKNKYGRIINIASVVPKIGVRGTSAYSASKSALWGLTRTLCVENAQCGITVNTLNLGYFDIGMITEVPENMKEAVLRDIPCHKLGDPEDIYSTIKYLINTPYVNGANIDINGGLI